MCFSLANRLPFRLTCLTGGVQWCCLCQRDVFDSFMSRVIFPPTSFWGKPWRFGTPIAFLASSVLFQMLPFQLDVQILSSFGLTKQLPVIPFWFPGSSEKLKMRGHRSAYLLPAKRALYHLSYIPSEETGSWWHLKPFFCQYNGWRVFYCISF